MNAGLVRCTLLFMSTKQKYFNIKLYIFDAILEL